MGRVTGIEWCHHTFNPWRGCSKVSDGCKNCYAERGSGRNPAVLGQWGPDGTRVVAAEAMWREPEKWDADARKAGVRRRVFCASLADWLEEWSGEMVDASGYELHAPDEIPANRYGVWWSRLNDWDTHLLTMGDARRRLWNLIGRTPHLDWLLLTKRAEWLPFHAPYWSAYAMTAAEARGDAAYVEHCRRHLSPPNVWFGVSVESQKWADDRAPMLCRTPAARRFFSVEPLLGPVDLRPWLGPADRGGVEWVIVGGESGGAARPFDPHWARMVRDQCNDAGVAFFMKQMGDAPVDQLDGSGRPLKLLNVDGWDDIPPELRVREFPGVVA